MKYLSMILLLTGLCLFLTLAIGQEADKTTPDAAPEAVSTPERSTPRDFSQPVREPAVGREISKYRAFLGAPPPVRHSIRTERSSDFCLECHATENRIELRQHAIAPMPHQEHSQCLQCHVKGNNKKIQPFRENDFVGLDMPGKGSRAHPFAPPTIPHKTFMRENCLTCHGPSGIRAIRTDHPDRSQCLQCHVPEATQNYDRPVDWKAAGGKL